MKTYARDHDLMVMGPDCGTAIVNGVPLGFANVVRRGPIGVVGASGTGTQEVTVRIHQLGSGVSQALGTGGHDLSQQIGGISMLHGLRALDADPHTKVIVLVSKPPAPEVAARVLAAAEASAKPVVVIFLGADPASITRNGVYGAAYLAQAADMAVALAKGGEAARSARSRCRTRCGARSAGWPARWRRASVMCAAFSPAARSASRRSSSTLRRASRAFSNTPTAGNRQLENNGKSQENTIIDMGDDEFTQGRPHPMIDPSLRDARIREEVADPTTAVVLFDVVLGYGASDGSDRRAARRHRLGQGQGRRRRAARSRSSATSAAPTRTRRTATKVVAGLKSAGVLVASSNAEAATLVGRDHLRAEGVQS